MQKLLSHRTRSVARTPKTLPAQKPRRRPAPTPAAAQGTAGQYGDSQGAVSEQAGQRSCLATSSSTSAREGGAGAGGTRTAGEGAGLSKRPPSPLRLAVSASNKTGKAAEADESTVAPAKTHAGAGVLCLNLKLQQLKSTLIDKRSMAWKAMLSFTLIIHLSSCSGKTYSCAHMPRISDIHYISQQVRRQSNCAHLIWFHTE